MTSVLNKDVAAHIFKHVERVCEVTLPTGAALEVAVARGFIDNNKHTRFEPLVVLILLLM